MKKENNKLGWLFTSPYIIFSLIFFVIPLLFSFWLAFTNWNMISPTFYYIGLDNFTAALKSKGVQAAFFVVYKFLLIYVPLVMIVSMVIALMVNNLKKHKGIYLVAFFLPYLSSGVVSSLIVNGILSYNGPINTFLRSHWGVTLDWTKSPFVAILVISLMIAWKMSGYYALILVSGLSSINTEIYEAAAIDGVTGWQRFWKVTIPMLYPSLFSVLIMAVGVTFGIFTEVYQLTGGGPSYATNTWQMEIYNQAFINLNSGYASSIALISSVVTFVSIGIIRKILEKWGSSNGWE